MREEKIVEHAIFDEPEIEYIEGGAYPKVSPKRTHSLVQSRLLMIFGRCGSDRGDVGGEWRVRLSEDTTLVPDISFVSDERLDTLDEDAAEEPPFAPDIAVEVRSPSFRPALAAKKIELYFQYGAQLVLDVDPQQRTIEVYERNGTRRVFRSGDRFGMPQFPWLQFEVDEVFAPLDRRRRRGC